MKLRMFNGVVTSTTLQAVSGGFDKETGRATVIVRGEGENCAGMLTLDPGEARKLVTMLLNGLPEVERVEADKEPATKPTVIHRNERALGDGNKP